MTIDSSSHPELERPRLFAALATTAENKNQKRMMSMGDGYRIRVVSNELPPEQSNGRRKAAFCLAGLQRTGLQWPPIRPCIIMKINEL